MDGRGETKKIGVGVANLLLEFRVWRLSRAEYTHLAALKPKVDPFCDAIKTVIAGILGIPPSAIGVNATSGEHMTPFGKGEGIQVFAIVSIIAKPASPQ